MAGTSNLIPRRPSHPSSSLIQSDQVDTIDEDSSYALAIKSSCSGSKDGSFHGVGTLTCRNNSIDDSGSASSSSSESNDAEMALNNNNLIVDNGAQSNISGIGGGGQGGGERKEVEGTADSESKTVLKCDIVEYL